MAAEIKQKFDQKKDYLYQNIQSYQKAGFALFPVRMVNGTKMPACGKGISWTETVFNPDLEPRMLGTMFGVVLQSDDLVIDVDPRRFVNNINSLEKFWDDLDLPKPIGTFVVNTMNKGLHVYFKKPSGIDVIRNLEKLYPGIEIKSRGQFVVGAGSWWGDKRYTLDRGCLEKILDAPESLLEFSKRPDKAIRSDSSIETDEPAVVARFISYLQTCPPAIEGQMGDRTTFQTACMGRDFGLSEQYVSDLMLEHYNPRCSPPWETQDLITKVENAFKYASGTQGSRSTVEEDFADSDFRADESQNKSKKVRVVSAKELGDTQFPLLRWAIEPILPEGLNILAGAPKTGKSWLALQMAIAVAEGGRVMKTFQADKGSVLYLALEDNDRRLKERLEKLGGKFLDNLHFVTEINRMHKRGIRQLEIALNSAPDCRLLVIDTLARFYPPSNRDSNAYENDYLAMAKLQDFAKSRNLAVMVITHLRKQKSSDDPLEQVMGSTGVTGAADAIWLLKRGRQEKQGILQVTGRDIEEQEFAVRFDGSSCRWEILGNAAIFSLSAEKKLILDYVAKAAEPVGPKEVSQAIKKSEGAVKNMMMRMVDSSELEKVSRGKYVVPKESYYFTTF